MIWSDRDQDFVRLGEVASGSPRWIYPRIERIDLERVITIGGHSSSLGASEIVDAMRSTLAGLDLPAGYRVEIGGEPEDQARAQRRLYSNFPFALATIALLLISQFNSIRRGGIILMTVPGRGRSRACGHGRALCFYGPAGIGELGRYCNQ